MTNLTRSIVLGCSMLALAACGADDVVAPGGPIVVPTPGPTPGPSPTPTPGTVQPAANCTEGTTYGGTVALQNGRGAILNCIIPNRVTTDLTLSGRRADGIMYSLNGRTDVGTDIALTDGTEATLTVLPGVTIFAQTRDTALIVNRGSQLVADGAADQPIIFTALANLTGQGLTEATDNLWGGLIINGRAPISDCDPTYAQSNVGGSAGCWRNAEGVTQPTLYGGDIADDNSGILRYVQVNFTGVGANADEIQGITTGGVGSGTVMSHIQVHNSLDDGIESFGGTQNMDHLILTGIADDSLDTDFGYSGTIQFALAVRRADGTVGDSATNQTLFEIDSSSAPDALPRQKLKFANFTFVQSTPGEPAIRIRGGADVFMANGIVIAPAGGAQGCLDVDNAETVRGADDGLQDDGPPVFHSVVFDCQLLIDADADDFEEATLSNPENSGVERAFENTLATLTGAQVGNFAPGTAEAGITVFTGLTAISAYFQDVDYIGAFSGPDDDWAAGWTCNSDVADLGGATSCIDIRIS